MSMGILPAGIIDITTENSCYSLDVRNMTVVRTSESNPFEFDNQPLPVVEVYGVVEPGSSVTFVVNKPNGRVAFWSTTPVKAVEFKLPPELNN